MPQHPVDAVMRVLAADQYDCFSREQVLAAGGNDGLIARRLKRKEWIARAPGVYGFDVRKASWWMDLWIAHLRAGLDSAISHESGAALHQVSTFSLGPVVVTVPHPSHRQPDGLVVHQTRYLPAHHVTRINGLAVTSLPRTFVDLSMDTRVNRLRACLETAVIEKKVSLSKVSACLLEMTNPGRPWIFKLGLVIDELGPGQPVPGSVMEAALHHALARAEEPKPLRQYAHPGRMATAGCVDYAYPSAKLIIEVDGRRWHTRQADMKRDHARDTAAALAGWHTLRLLYEDLYEWPEDAIATIRALRTQREAVMLALS